MVGPERVAGGWWQFDGGGDARPLVGEGGLVAQGALQKSVGCAGLVWATDLTAPEAAELVCVDCVTGYGYVDHVGAGQDRCREGGREPEDLVAPLEDAFVQSLKLFRCGRDELACVGEPGD